MPCVAQPRGVSLVSYAGARFALIRLRAEKMQRSISAESNEVLLPRKQDAGPSTSQTEVGFAST